MMGYPKSLEITHWVLIMLTGWSSRCGHGQ